MAAKPNTEIDRPATENIVWPTPIYIYESLSVAAG